MNWLKNPLTVPLLFIIIGVALFLYQSGFFAGPVNLEERTFLLNNRTASILAPENSEQRQIPSGVAFRKRGNILIVSVATAGKFEFAGSITCNMMKRKAVFTVHNIYLNEETEICDEPINLSENPEYKGYKLLMSGSVHDDGIEYLISVIGKEGYFNSQEGMEKVKQIFESFKIKQ